MATIIFIHCSQSEMCTQGLFLPDSLSVSFRHSQSRLRASAPLSKALPSVKEHKASEIYMIRIFACMHASHPDLVVAFPCHSSCPFCSLCSSRVAWVRFLLAGLVDTDMPIISCNCSADHLTNVDPPIKNKKRNEAAWKLHASIRTKAHNRKNKAE